LFFQECLMIAFSGSFGKKFDELANGLVATFLRPSLLMVELL
jgi:hypothetical protein